MERKRKISGVGFFPKFPCLHLNEIKIIGNARSLRSLVWICLILMGLPLLTHAAVTGQEIRDAILGNKTFTQQKLETMDLNSDGNIDVTDLIYYFLNPASLVGEHFGVMYRNNADLVAGQGEVFGQIPFALSISDESPLVGAIDNTPESDSGYSSLYFPKELIPVTFTADPDDDLKFTVDFETYSPNLSPDTPDKKLGRSITFAGSFQDEDRRVLSGTYTETILGFKDNQNKDIGIVLTGKFVLVFNIPEPSSTN